jgi:hypothetical protein
MPKIRAQNCAREWEFTPPQHPYFDQTSSPAPNNPKLLNPPLYNYKSGLALNVTTLLPNQNCVKAERPFSGFSICTQ